MFRRLLREHQPLTAQQKMPVTVSVHTAAPTTSADRAGAALPRLTETPAPGAHQINSALEGQALYWLSAQANPQARKGSFPLVSRARFHWLGAWGVRLLATSLVHQ